MFKLKPLLIGVLIAVSAEKAMAADAVDNLAAIATSLNITAANGATTIGNSSGATTISSQLIVTGATTGLPAPTLLQSGVTVTNGGIINTGNLTQNGTVSINDTSGATTINTGAGSGTVIIGNIANTTALNSGTTTISGITQINNSLGVTGGATISGVTNINNNSGADITNIGTGTTVGNVSIGSGTATQAIAITAGTGGTAINSIGTTSIGNLATSGAVIIGSGININPVTLTSGTSSIQTNNGTNTITGITNINTTGSANTAIGNNNAASTVTTTAGNSTTSLANNAATTSVGTLANGSSSTLTNVSAVTQVSSTVDGTSGAMTIVNAGQAGGYSVNGNGSISSTALSADQQAAAGLTLTNSAGNTNGIVVLQNKTSITGGTSQPTGMVLSNNGATFSNTQTGQAVQLHGVASGSAATDAVNLGQLNSVSTRAYSGIAQIAAMQAVPAPVAGKNYSIGMGGGFYAGQQAIAFGAKANVNESVNVTASVANGFGSNNDLAAAVGAGYSW